MDAVVIKQINLLESPAQPTPGAVRQWLSQHLREHGIDTREWGSGPYKGFEHLLNEILSGETQLGVVDEKVHRICSVLRIDVRYRAGENPELQLFEAEQIFTDGRRRERPTPYAVCEKLKQNEDLDEAVSRAVQEELQIEGAVNSSYLLKEVFVEHPLDFPGLPSLLTAIDYQVHLTTQQFSAQGYEEKQADKTTYFRWRPPSRTVSQTASPDLRPSELRGESEV
jgi:hypothetical protein